MPTRSKHDWVLYPHWLKLHITLNKYLLQMIRQKKSTQKIFLPMWQLLQFLPILFALCLPSEGILCSNWPIWSQKTPCHLPLGELRTNLNLRSTGSSSSSVTEPQPVPVSLNMQLCSPAGFTLPRLLPVSSIFNQNKSTLHTQGNFRVPDLW